MKVCILLLHSAMCNQQDHKLGYHRQRISFLVFYVQKVNSQFRTNNDEPGDLTALIAWILNTATEVFRLNASIRNSFMTNGPLW
jgi:hypothetical protein